MDDLYDGFDIDDAANTLLNDNDDDATTTTNTNPSMGTAFSMNESVRPMTSNKSAGYSSKSKKSKFKSRKANQAITNKHALGNNNHDDLSLRAEEMETNVNKVYFYPTTRNTIAHWIRTKMSENG